MTVADDEVAMHCPLCNYSLRGLVEPRCPECGFKFEWAELRDAARTKHPYLFEHGAGHNLRTFWLTFWRDWRPRKFWRELSPAHPIRLRRLAIYWLISNFGLLLLLPAILFAEVIRQANANANNRAGIAKFRTLFAANPKNYAGWTFARLTQLSQNNPSPTSIAFWRAFFPRSQMDWSQSNAIIIEILWIVITLLTLLIFQQSMRRKNIRNAHLVRVVVYCCNYPALMSMTIALASMSRNCSLLIVIGVLFSVTTYRLYFSYVRYLRLSFPRLTVLAAQTIVTLVIILFVLNFTREGYRWWMLRW